MNFLQYLQKGKKNDHVENKLEHSLYRDYNFALSISDHRIDFINLIVDQLLSI